jgi:hypothetical protein
VFHQLKSLRQIRGDSKSVEEKKVHSGHATEEVVRGISLVLGPRSSQPSAPPWNGTIGSGRPAIAGQMYSRTEVRVTATSRTVDSIQLQRNYQNRRRRRQHGLSTNTLDLSSSPLYSPVMQAEQKTVPTNTMKELRIEKLVISAFTTSRSARWGDSGVVQTSPSVNLVTG